MCQTKVQEEVKVAMPKNMHAPAAACILGPCQVAASTHYFVCYAKEKKNFKYARQPYCEIYGLDICRYS